MWLSFRQMLILIVFLFLTPDSPELYAQPNSRLGAILTEVFESEILKPYLPVDTLGHPDLRTILVGNRTPTRIPLRLFGQEITFVREGEDRSSGDLILLKRLTWKPGKALVVLKLQDQFQGRFRLKYAGEHWVIAQAYVHGIARRNGHLQRSWAWTL